MKKLISVIFFIDFYWTMDTVQKFLRVLQTFLSDSAGSEIKYC
jgi:hypothetical protein